MAWDSGSIISATPWAALSAKLQAMCGTTGVENWQYVGNVPAGVGVNQSGTATLSCDVFRCRGASTLYKRLVGISLSTNAATNPCASSVDATSYAFTTASTTGNGFVAPSINQFIIVTIFNTKASAADDPTSVTMDGSNAPTFTKVKSQASGDGSTVMKATMWIGKTGSSTPTGTTLTVAFGATQTGCVAVVDQFDGCNMTLSASGLDPTGAAQIGIQVGGGSGTTQTAHATTLSSALLGNQSCIYITAASWGTTTMSVYGISQGYAYPATVNQLVQVNPFINPKSGYNPDPLGDTTPTLTLGGSGNESGWAAVSLEFQRTTQSTSVTSPNDAGKDWYFVLEIPVTDNGTLTSHFSVFEDYDGSSLFRRPCPVPSTSVPISPGAWRDNVLNQYISVTGLNTANTNHQILNTTGFNYWIKLTPNLVIVSTRVSTTEATNGGMLIDSFITNTTDFPLMSLSAQSGNGNSYSRIPGVTTGGITGQWGQQAGPWTAPVNSSVITSNVQGSQDKWSSNKIHATRIFSSHQAGAGSVNVLTQGYARGLWKTDILGINQGGTVQLGDTMTISGNTWTVIGKSNFSSSGGLSMNFLTRAN